jgi:hypothetical protein
MVRCCDLERCCGGYRFGKPSSVIVSGQFMEKHPAETAGVLENTQRGENMKICVAALCNENPLGALLLGKANTAILTG